MSPSSFERLHREGRGLVTGSFVRIALVFVILAIAANETGQVVMAKIRVQGATDAAASAGADAYYMTRNPVRAQTAALEAAAESDPGTRVTSFQAAYDGTVTVRATGTAHTWILQRLSFLRHLGIEHAVEEGKHVP